MRHRVVGLGVLLLALGCGEGGGEPPGGSWYLTRGGAENDGAWTVAVDDAGYLYLAASLSDPEGMTNVHIFKLTPEGTEVWEAVWGGPWKEQAFIAVVSGTSLYVGGHTFTSDDADAGDMFIAKFDTSDGRLVWDIPWDGNGGYDEVDGIVVEGDTLYVAGWAQHPNGNPDIALLKLRDHGETVELLWGKTWGNAGDGWWNGWDEGNGQIVVDAQNIYVAGRVNGTAWPVVTGDAALVAFDKEEGNYRWHTTWDNGYWLDDALGMIADGSYLYVVGMTWNTADLKSDIFVLKYDVGAGPPTEPVWARTWGGDGNDLSRSVAIGPDGSVFVAGHAGAGDDGVTDVVSGDAVLLKYTPDGILLWAKRWGGTGGERVKDIRIHGRAVYLAGQTSSYGAGLADALLLKTDLDGAGLD